ncbi:hypothetical protein GDO78_004417 [Eleutherodactylus coqui]|uniref:Uncharacterized protein n=1 Tax=Eleutherodactylus coqui TaxID=57060 RepID=A0A8J6EQU7_ELECQ|nr:hypothetical protein GDO78_004417 [Eleutherodactylus coqui]
MAHKYIILIESKILMHNGNYGGFLGTRGSPFTFFIFSKYLINKTDRGKFNFNEDIRKTGCLGIYKIVGVRYVFFTTHVFLTLW